jgi:hypothetical protein
MTATDCSELLRSQLEELGHQLILCLGIVGVARNAIDRANLAALRRIEVAYALGTLARIDDVDLVALRNRVIGAFRFANVAVDAFVGNDQGHGFFLGEKSANFRFQPLGHQRLNKLGYIAAESSNFTHHGG